MAQVYAYVPLSTTDQSSQSSSTNHSSIHRNSSGRLIFQNKYILLSALFASIGGLTFGYDQGIIANVLDMKTFAERWPIGAWEKGIISKPMFWTLEFKRPSYGL